MKKIFVKVFVLLFFLVGYGYAADQPYKMSVFFNIYKPELVMPVKNDNTIKKPDIEWQYGGGITYNGLRVGASNYLEGYRVYAGYDFFESEFVNPYMGLSYIGGIYERYNSTTKQKLQGIDTVLGFSFNFFGYFKPYIEYSFYNNYFHYGMRVHLGKVFYRK